MHTFALALQAKNTGVRRLGNTMADQKTILEKRQLSIFSWRLITPQPHITSCLPITFSSCKLLPVVLALPAVCVQAQRRAGQVSLHHCVHPGTPAVVHGTPGDTSERSAATSGEPCLERREGHMPNIDKIIYCTFIKANDVYSD